MLQAVGLTSAPRRRLPVVVDGLTFEARPGHVTALLGAPGSGKTAVLRLMLELDPGRGVTYFRGRPPHRIARPAHEVAVFLGGAPGHPARTARRHPRMLCAAVGVPVSRADEVLDLVGLAALRDRRVDALPLGGDRALARASAPLGDPHTLVLDDPAEVVPPREAHRVHRMARDRAARGGTVPCTTAGPGEALRAADRVVTVDGGRLVARPERGRLLPDPRLRPGVRCAVRTPPASPPSSVVGPGRRDATSRWSRGPVAGSPCTGPPAPRSATRPSGTVSRCADSPTRLPTPGPCTPPPRRSAPQGPWKPERARPRGRTAETRAADRAPVGPRPPSAAAPRTASPPRCRCDNSGRRPGPCRPARDPRGPRTLRVRPAAQGAGGPAVTPAAAPTAIGAGLLGALSSGDEFRHPPRHGVRRRPAPLRAAPGQAGGVGRRRPGVRHGCRTDLRGVHRLVHDGDLTSTFHKFPMLYASWAGQAVGCARVGLPGAGAFRATAAGVAAVLAVPVPVLVVPLLRAVSAGAGFRPAAGLPGRFRELLWPHWPHEAERWSTAVVRVVARPVAAAVSFSLSILACACPLTGLRGRVRWRRGRP